MACLLIFQALGDERRSFSYYKAIPVIEKLPFKIESIDQVKHLPTIGKSLQDHVSITTVVLKYVVFNYVLPLMRNYIMLYVSFLHWVDFGVFCICTSIDLSACSYYRYPWNHVLGLAFLG